MTPMLEPFLLVLLVSAILTPRVAMAVGYVTGTVTVLTICTGHDLVTITLDAQGEPVSETMVHSEPCVMSVANLPSPTGPTTWQALHISYVSKSAAFTAVQPITSRWSLRPPSQGPPVSI